MLENQVWLKVAYFFGSFSYFLTCFIAEQIEAMDAVDPGTLRDQQTDKERCQNQKYSCMR